MAGNSEGQRKGAATKKQNYGKDVFAKMGSKKSSSKGGYLRKLKEEGRMDELKAISRKGATTTNALKAKQRYSTKGDEGRD